MDQVPPIEPTSAPPAPFGMRILRPLRIRDFALLFGGTAVSMFGDGIYIVAIAWQVYDLSNAPTALSLVGVAWTLPMVLFLLVGGVLGDRFDRRRLMIGADALRALAIGVIAVLAFAGTLELWHLVALVAVYGAGEALFAPNFQAVVPDVVPQRLLVEANSLQQLAEPVAYRFVGPARGRAADRGCRDRRRLRRRRRQLPRLARLHRPDAAAAACPHGCPDLRARGPARGGRLRPLAGVAVGDPALGGADPAALPRARSRCSCPSSSRTSSEAERDALGLVLGASGVGAIFSGLWLGQRGIGRRYVLWAYVGWGLSVLCLAGYALTTEIWQAVAIGFVSGMASPSATSSG